MEEQPLVRHLVVAPDPEYYYNLMNGDYCERIMSEPLPPGMRFLPTDVELMQVYLKQKLIIGSLPHGLRKLFLDVTLYQHSLKNSSVRMHEQSEEDQEDWYFFTPRNRKYLNGQRPGRTTGNGYWKAIEKDTPIVEYDGEVIGFKRVSDFYEGRHLGGVKTEWKMHEYLTKEQKDHTHAGTTSMQLNKWVLCKIKRKIIDYADEHEDNYVRDKQYHEEAFQ
ncbi:UNVERIFIED_CONTAM: NAC domain-containing protein 1 [Sesamum calycinum]|uniref:NAC domain-containing protein 1 n=1 Tax=Sesamum calycinum TaxID=2727403 RepID=A0AAW2QKJ5_9LAMI